MRRALLPIPILWLALTAAACGSGPVPPPTPPPGTGSPPAAGNGTQGAPTLPAGTVPAPPTAIASARPTKAACTEILDRWAFAREQLDLLSALTDDEVWAAAHEADSGLTLDPDALDRAIDTLATLPGQSDTIDLMRAVVPLYRAALRSPAPFADASGVGQRLLEAAQNAGAIAKVEIQNAIDVAGCGEV